MLSGMRIFTRRIIYFYSNLLRRGQRGVKCSSQAHNLGKSAFQRGFFLVKTRAPSDANRVGGGCRGRISGWMDGCCIHHK